jgi:alpha-beta hydrolase superfamily lysophospholipase
MIPKFFGDADRQLFGIYHAPAPAEARDVGVVLCHAGPHEYRHTYWSFRRLAGLLAKAGLHVLRFDYGGTGDSTGELATESLGAWTKDVRTAARELKELAGTRRLSLVGMRLGAVVAARAAADGLRVDDLVLWEPVVRGSDYLAQLDALEEDRIVQLRYPQFADRVPGEILGYSLGESARAELAAVDLTTGGFGTPKRAVIVASAAVPAHEQLRLAMEAAGVQATPQVVEDPAVRGGEAIAGTLLAQSSLQEIVQSLSARRAG